MIRARFWLFVAAFGASWMLAGGSPARADIRVPADYPTIQAAVNAADCGDTIRIAPGVYEEQIVIFGKSLTLVGRPGTILRARTDMTNQFPAFPGADGVMINVFNCNVRLKNLTLDGARRGNGYGLFAGIYYFAAGGSVRNCHVHGFRSDPFAQATYFARGVAAFNLAAWGGSPMIDVEVRDCAFEDNQVAVYLGGDDIDHPNDMRATVHVEHNTIVGVGPTAAAAQIGVWVDAGATGEIKHNTISEHLYLGSDQFSEGILCGNTYGPSFTLIVPDFDIQNNTLTDNEVGIAAIFNHRAEIANNTIVAGPYSFAAIAVSGDRNKVHHNDISMVDSQLPGNNGVALLGEEFGGAAGYGVASHTTVSGNTIAGADTPIWIQTGVTGTVLRNNHVTP